jgi:hypothetical protein
MLHSSNFETLQACLLLQAKQKLFCSLTVLTIILNAPAQLCEEYCFVRCDAMCLIKCTLQMNVLPQSSPSSNTVKMERACSSETTKFLSAYTKSHCRRQ